MDGAPIPDHRNWRKNKGVTTNLWLGGSNAELFQTLSRGRPISFWRHSHALEVLAAWGGGISIIKVEGENFL